MKKYLSSNQGFTLVELLAVLAIVTIVFSLAYSVLYTVINFNEKNSAEILLEQEANVIINDIKNRHHGDDIYQLCYDQLLLNPDLTMQLKVNSTIVNAQQPCTSDLDPEEDLQVELNLVDSAHNSLTLETAVEGRTSELIVLQRQSDSSFYSFLRANNVYIYTSEFIFQGNQVNGSNASIVILGDMITEHLNGGALNQVSTIYIDGDVRLSGGSAGIGSASAPGEIVVNGDLSLWEGRREIFGDVYVNGNLRLKDAVINGNIYVNGDVELGWTPTLNGNSKIYYTGTLSHPDNYREGILRNVVQQEQVAVQSIPNNRIPNLRDDSWFMENGYTNTITSDQNMKIFGNNINLDSHYNSTADKYVDSFTNFIIVSKGDISIGGKSWINKFSGLVIAPNGKVTFNGSSFEGIVIARDGFHVKSGGTKVNYLHIDEYIKGLSEFPLVQ
ncbi:prepilin-type N-terminal cleavage/methylation domain-containing protein [Ornithinibacillus scapharcae]|uniref:prepilin-type N-terminal cleavage/methylation domain-containing protein n=1 Tax=Ornithinibacillus scapharcae TaxID=1147159 RepID=UPI000225C18B|nr:prepilin-type N-terminal cleavage/methylation domain-containing protein [Ornithinibacillus scapharcae]